MWSVAAGAKAQECEGTCPTDLTITFVNDLAAVHIEASGVVGEQTSQIPMLQPPVRMCSYDRDETIETFRRDLQRQALAALEENREYIFDLYAPYDLYEYDDPEEYEQALAELRGVVLLDQLLADRQTLAQNAKREADYLSVGYYESRLSEHEITQRGLERAHAMFGKDDVELPSSALDSRESLQEYWDALTQKRIELRAFIPELAFMSTERLGRDPSGEEVRKNLSQGLGRTLEALDTTKHRVRNGDLPFTALDPIITRLRARFGADDCRLHYIDEFLRRARRNENIVRWGGIVLPAGLGIASFFVSGPAGLTAGLAIAGSALGAAAAVWEFERAMDVYQAARAQQHMPNPVVGKSLNEARLDFVFAGVDVLLSGVDLVLTFRQAKPIVQAAATRFSTPIVEPGVIDVNKVRSVFNRQAADLDKMGAKVVRETGWNYASGVGSVRYVNGTATDISELGLLKITDLPPPRSSSPLARALTHPDLPQYLARMEEMGVDLVIDPSLRVTGAGAYFLPGSRVIALQADSSWKTFVHEYQHALFNQYVRTRFTDVADAVNNGLHVRNVLPTDVVEALGDTRITRLQRLLERQIPISGVNETLSVADSLDTLGFRKFVLPHESVEALWSYGYAQAWQAQSLRALKVGGGLTELQARQLQLAVRRSVAARAGALAVATGSVAAVGVAGAVTVYYSPELGAWVVETADDILVWYEDALAP